MSDFDFRAYLYISILAVLADRDSILAEIVFPSMYFNPRGPCGPRPTLGKSTDGTETISILAVLADRDGCLSWNIYSTSEFQSSRSLRTATRSPGQSHQAFRFQSSRSLRTATSTMFPKLDEVTFQSSRSLRTATFYQHQEDQNKEFQSSRSLRTATGRKDPTATSKVAFQSSRSLRTATAGAYHLGTPDDNFNPRGPCGPRP